MWTGISFFNLRRILCVSAVLFSFNAHAFEFSLSDTWCGVTGATRLACDTTNDLVYVTSPLAQEVVVFDVNGNIVNTIETPGRPGAICMAESGHVIVSVGRSVFKMTTDGVIVTTYGAVEDYFVDPHDVVWVADGRVYVSDDDDRIKVFDSAGMFLFSFGEYGYFNGRFDEPVSMVHNPVTDELVVTDQNNYRIQTFSLDGDWLRKWGAEGNGVYTDGAFYRPFGIDVDASGRVWVLDVLTDLVEVFDTTGVYETSAGLNSPNIRGGVDIALDGDVMYVTSPSTNCVYVYSILGSEPPNNFPPFQLTILWTGAGVQLNWKPLSGAIGYHIQRSADINFAEAAIELIGFTSDTVFTDVFEAFPHDVCYYRVIADIELPGRFDPAYFGHGADGSEDGRLRDALDTEHDSPHHVTHGVNCNSCHLRGYDYPSPLPEWWFGDHLCKSCHVETGFAVGVQTHLGSDTLTCRICHSPHYQQPQYPRYFIRNENPVGESNSMLFNHATDFIHGAPAFDGICEICHTQTTYYRSDGFGAEHNPGSNCLDCHAHERGFMAENHSARERLR